MFFSLQDFCPSTTVLWGFGNFRRLLCVSALWKLSKLFTPAPRVALRLFHWTVQLPAILTDSFSGAMLTRSALKFRGMVVCCLRRGRVCTGFCDPVKFNECTACSESALLECELRVLDNKASLYILSRSDRCTVVNRSEEMDHEYPRTRRDFSILFRIDRPPIFSHFGSGQWKPVNGRCMFSMSG
ncbi:hypothetical protein BaRGS_00036717 [Batillaria attramentaria]|uniref:Secreted protein n=1 Tax=Batillaria attramentaria TaxID=370345 RepID=A0ABD0JB40_9CAEN